MLGCMGGWVAEEDRRERRRKLGLPEELTPEEKAAEAVKQAEAAKAKASRALPIKPVSLTSQLRDVLVRLGILHSFTHRRYLLMLRLPTDLRLHSPPNAVPGAAIAWHAFLLGFAR